MNTTSEENFDTEEDFRDELRKKLLNKVPVGSTLDEAYVAIRTEEYQQRLLSQLSE